MSYHQTPEGKDPQLWEIARKRASFRSHLITYLLVNAFLWIVWYFTGTKNYEGTIPWPAWSMFGWGVGLLSHYIGAYKTNSNNAIENEYNKLSNK